MRTGLEVADLVDHVATHGAPEQEDRQLVVQLQWSWPRVIRGSTEAISVKTSEQPVSRADPANQPSVPAR
eukprot:6074-Eustigmatos_ZCMA.PRE.1